MIAQRLVEIVEADSADMALDLVNRILSDPHAHDYCDRVPHPELFKRIHETYRHLGDWLLTRTEADIEQRYRTIGERRAQQGVTLTQVVWAILQTREYLWSYLAGKKLLCNGDDLSRQVELVSLLDHFYHRAVYFCLVGYEDEVRRSKHMADVVPIEMRTR
jgi:hypothetical protein